MRIKKFFVIAAVACSVMAMPASSARAEGWFDFLFPEAPTGPQPHETLKAPFANTDAVVQELDASGEVSNMTPLHLRHRTNAVISRWVEAKLPELLSYKHAGYEEQYKEKAAFFSKVGLGEYVQFLQSSNYLTTLKTGRYNISSFVVGFPVLLNEGAMEGNYRWLYQVKIMTTYMEDGATDYNHIKDGSTINQEYTINFQLGRSRSAANEHGVLLESWNAKLDNK